MHGHLKLHSRVLAVAGWEQQRITHPHVAIPRHLARPPPHGHDGLGEVGGLFAAGGCSGGAPLLFHSGRGGAHGREYVVLGQIG